MPCGDVVQLHDALAHSSLPVPVNVQYRANLGHAIDHSDLSAGCGWCVGGYSSLDQSVSLGLRALNRGDAKTGRDDCGTNCPHPLGAVSDGLQNNQS